MSTAFIYQGHNEQTTKLITICTKSDISVRRAAMCVVSRFWLRLFRYSLVFILAALVGLLGLWLATNQDLSSMKYVGRNGINKQGDLELRTATKASGVAGKNKESKTNNIFNARGNREKTWMHPKIESDHSGNRGIKMKFNQNGKAFKSQTSINAINKLNRDTTKNSLLESKIEFPSSFTVITSNGRPKFPAAKVYGESGCADNPWRGGLSELFQAWTNISKQHNIEYVLACGSLLGAMRNGDVIPYDSDIDILIDINYWPVMKRLSVKRNFTRTDGKIHLVVQPEFTLNIPDESRKRYDCQGKVMPVNSSITNCRGSWVWVKVVGSKKGLKGTFLCKELKEVEAL